ncbi:MAG: family 78 glycoside hydrolase catalytic domain [Dysgonamonadaceae bacterium]|jgi:alpha-L-rhamnosidase|nr:family 78 glycoside hydrolase catalytic domain [Dysgonamonadaceae bacterium]
MKKIYLILLLLLAAGYSYAGELVSVVNLRCEYLTNPLGIDMQHPRLSWELSSQAKGKKQKAYRILVATDSLALEKDKANVWDTRKTAGNQTGLIAYNGKSLQANTLYYWKVCVWDEKGTLSAWSPIARFMTGPLSSAGWKAQWIGDREDPIDAVIQYYRHDGYHSLQEPKADAQKWITIDLKQEQAIDAIRLHPVQYRERLFPQRFSVELASTSDFRDARVIVDESAKDVVIRPACFYYKKLDAPVKGRYLRLNIEKLALADKDKNLYEFGLSELEALYDAENIALNCPVQVSDTTEVSYLLNAALVTDGHIVPSNRRDHSDHIPPSPLLRKEIKINKKIKNAFLTASALGVYEAYINGQKVGKHVLAPEFTDYDSRVQFQTYEVTAMLQTGTNALGAMLADGWYAGGRWSHPNRGGYGYFRKFIGQLLINYEDGTSEIIGTDGSWKLTERGPVTEAANLLGEMYDARYEQKGWSSPGFDDSRWENVFVYPSAAPPVQKATGTPQFRAQMNEAIEIIDEIKPVAFHKVGRDKYIFDMGQNMVGWCRLTLPYNPGRHIRLRYGEMLYDDGSLYTDNLRYATQTDIYKPFREQAIDYEPRFTFHGFRYVEVEGLTQEPRLDNILGKMIASTSPATGSFSTSDMDINKLWENIRWTQWGNMTSIPTDCPQRDEREGWMADAHIFSQTAIYNLDMAAFYTKWARDIEDTQLEDGRFADYSPNDGSWHVFFGAPGWADAGVIIPWQVYLNYGDTLILSEHYESMKKFINYVYRKNPDMVWKNGISTFYGDHLNGNTIIADDYPKDGGKIPDDVFSTAYFAYSTGLLAKSAKILGKEKDFDYYNRLATAIRKTFVEKFVSSDGKIEGNTQSAYAMALQFELLPKALRPLAAEHMAEAVKAYDYRISTGIHSTIWLMNQLSEYGYSDIAYKLLFSRRFPSWLYSIDQGATTIWERWDGYVAGRGFQYAGMNSFNHVAIGAVGEWMYKHILGIQLDESKPAYNHFFIKPQPGKILEWAKGSYHSIAGNIEVSWTHKNQQFVLDVTIPVNTEATVVLPDGATHRIGSGQYSFKN